MAVLSPARVGEYARTVKDVGWVVIPDAIEADYLGAIAEDLLRLERELGIVPADNFFEGTRTTRILNLLEYGEIYEKMPVHPNVLPVVEQVLDPGLLVSSLSSISIGPDERPQPIHSDDQLIPLPKPHPPIICNTMWAITDFTDSNGATRIVPGTHLLDHSPDPLDAHESIPAEMTKGSVLVWVGSLWHGGGANTTGRRRVGVALNYCAGFIRQQENQQLGIPLDTIRRFPRRLQELVGFGRYNGLIGGIKKQSAAAYLFGAEETDTFLLDFARPSTPEIPATPDGAGADHEGA